MGLLEFVQDPQVTMALVSVTVTFLVIMITTVKQKKIALQPEVYTPFRLQEKEELSHDTRMFRFALQSPKHTLGLPIGQHVSMKFVDKDGKTVTRSYTPTSSDINLGHVDFVIKVYRPNVEPKFPEGGKMSMHLERLQIGDTVDMRGPKGNLTYMGAGNFRIKRRDDRRVRKLGMMAGGTGITPMLQIISAVMRESGGFGNSSQIEMSLIFANKSEDDILLRDMIEKLAAGNPNFKFHYTLDSAPPGWTHSEGFITKEMVAEHMPAPGADTLILMCGPPPMLKFACVPALEALGFSEDMHFSF